jgi:hypothetical protein
VNVMKIRRWAKPRLRIILASIALVVAAGSLIFSLLALRNCREARRLCSTVPSAPAVYYPPTHYLCYSPQLGQVIASTTPLCQNGGIPFPIYRAVRMW